MKLFTFDKYWGLDWEKKQQNLYTFSKDFGGTKFTFEANTCRASNPIFAIYNDKNQCIMSELDGEMLIMQMKSLKETGKIIIEFVEKQ